MLKKLSKFLQIFKEVFINVWVNSSRDIKFTWFGIKYIFSRYNVVIVFFFLSSVFIAFFYVIFLFIVVSLWLIYFYSFYFFYRFSKHEKCQKLDFKVYNYITDNYTGNLSLGNIFVFLKNFLYYNPKFLAYNFYYKSVKAFNLKKEYDSYFVIFVIISSIIIVFPIRLFIKWFTGFSYFSIKIATICTNQLSGILNSNWNFKNFYFNVVEVYLQSITSYFFLDLLMNAKNNKIYFNKGGVNIYFNPPKIPSTSKSGVDCGKYFKEYWSYKEAYNTGMKAVHPAYITLKNVEGDKKVFLGAVINRGTSNQLILLQSEQGESINFTDGSKLVELGYSHEGLFGRKHVTNYVYTVFKQNEKKIDELHRRDQSYKSTWFNKVADAFKNFLGESDTSTSNDPIIIDYKNYSEKELESLIKDRFISLKAFLPSIFENSYNITDTGVRQDMYFFSFNDKLTQMYDNGELEPDLYKSYYFMTHFLSANFSSPGKVGAKTRGDIFKSEIKRGQTPEDHKITLLKELNESIKLENGVANFPDTIVEPSFSAKLAIEALDKDKFFFPY